MTSAAASSSRPCWTRRSWRCSCGHVTVFVRYETHATRTKKTCDGEKKSKTTTTTTGETRVRTVARVILRLARARTDAAPVATDGDPHRARSSAERSVAAAVARVPVGGSPAGAHVLSDTFSPVPWPPPYAAVCSGSTPSLIRVSRHRPTTCSRSNAPKPFCAKVPSDRIHFDGIENLRFHPKKK
jgi:uncharacterized Zn-binding protein involved in type VI secretion